MRRRCPAPIDQNRGLLEFTMCPGRCDPPLTFCCNSKEKENSIMPEWMLHFLPEYAAVYNRIPKYARRPCYIRSYSTKWCSLSTDSPDYIRPYAPDAGGEVNGLKTCYWRLGSKYWLYNVVRNVGESLLKPSVSCCLCQQRVWGLPHGWTSSSISYLKYPSNCWFGSRSSHHG